MRTIDRIVWWAMLGISIYGVVAHKTPSDFLVWVVMFVAAGGRIRLMDLEDRVK